MKFSCFQFLLILLFDCDTYVDSSKAESDLYRELLTSYSSLVRPVKNALEPVKVLMRLHLQQIIDVDEKNQVVEINAWLNYRWWDYRLSWNMSAYENITSIRVASDDNVIWIPDILLYNSVDKTFDSTYKSNLVVYNTGEVNWVPPGIFRLSCRLVVTWFPFDEQSCFLKFSSWTYHAGALDLHLDLEPDEGKDFLKFVGKTFRIFQRKEWIFRVIYQMVNGNLLVRQQFDQKISSIVVSNRTLP
uniref:Neurotransmitter-gated ion-channel ligand-binding domain-containing protein n=1 Tax=Acrobeloides nanus TaxID=290746 RepID=A0A914CKN5_9BILA